MSTQQLLICGGAWLIGFAGVRYWWRKTYKPAGVGDYVLFAWAGLLGPVAWVAGWYLHACQRAVRDERKG